MDKYVNITLSLLGKIFDSINNAISSAVSKAKKDLEDAIGKKVDEAPEDNAPYARCNKNWVKLEQSNVEYASAEEVDEVLDSVFGKDEAASKTTETAE